MGQKEHKILQYVPQLARGTPRRRRESINAAATLQEVLVIFVPSISGGSARWRNAPQPAKPANNPPSIDRSFWVFLSVIWVCLIASRSACRLLTDLSLCLPACLLLRRSAHLHAYLLLSAWLAASRGSTILSSSAIRPRTDILTQ